MILITRPEADYELLDSGDGKKMERFGDFVLSRPDPQAMWKPLKSANEWNKADAVFVRDGKKTTWDMKKGVPAKWNIAFGDLRMEIMPDKFKHTGLFPEHRATWDWMREKILAAIAGTKRADADRPVSVLNLFAYTGGASLAAAQAGAHVTHVDGSKISIEWAKRNQKLSELPTDGIRWILDDVIAFLKREIKRGKTYDAIVMDPPAFGRGPDGEVWNIEEQLPELLLLCRKVLSDNPLFIVMNGYASGFSSIAYANNLLPFQQELGGTLEHGELAIEETVAKSHEKPAAKPETGRLLPAGIFARWSK